MSLTRTKFHDGKSCRVSPNFAINFAEPTPQTTMQSNPNLR